MARKRTSRRTRQVTRKSARSRRSPRRSVRRSERKSAKRRTRKSKGPSPYNLFVKKMSPILRSRNPGMKQPSIMKLIAKEWRKTP